MTLVCRKLTGSQSSSSLTATTTAAVTRSNRGNGNKTAGCRENHSAIMQRHLSRRLTKAARLRERSDSVVVQVRRQRRRVAAILTGSAERRRRQCALSEANKLRVLLEMVAQFRIHLLQYHKDRMEPQGFANVWRGIDKMVAKATAIEGIGRRVKFVQRRLEKVIAMANSVPIREAEEVVAAANPENDHQVLAAGPPAEETVPLAVAFPPHLWIPPILWKMYEHTERGGSKEHPPSEALRASMQQLMQKMRDLNPYSHLQVLYRPPPDNPNIKWEVRQSEAVRRIAASLTNTFAHLHRKAFWLASPHTPRDNAVKCWRIFTDVIESIRDLSAHFHYVVLYLYSVAMGREDSSVTVDTIAHQAATHYRRDDIREAYGLNPLLLATCDRLVQQSYSYFPETLVFLDQWRHEPSIQPYGFRSSEDANAFIIHFNQTERKGQRTLDELATHLKELYHLWRESKLGTHEFKCIQIHEIGALEQAVKGRFRSVTDLFYQQNVAHWIRNRQNLRHRIESLNILVYEPLVAAENVDANADAGPDASEKDGEKEETVPQSPHKDQELHPSGDTATVNLEEGNQQATVSAQDEITLDSAEVQEPPKPPRHFRAPGVLKLDGHPSSTNSVAVARRQSNPSVSSAACIEEEGNAKGEPSASGYSDQPIDPDALGRCDKADAKERESSLPKHEETDETESCSSKPCKPRTTGAVLLKDIYAWTDEEIDAYEQEKEHVNELQQKLLVLREKMSLETILDDLKRTWCARNLPNRSKHALSLVEGWVRVREFAQTATCYAEEVALHGAAEALIQRPSLRVDATNDSSPDDVPTTLTADAKLHLEAVFNLRELKDTIGASRQSIGEMLKGYHGDQSTEWRNHLSFFAEASKNLLQIASEQIPFAAVKDEDGEVMKKREPNCMDLGENGRKQVEDSMVSDHVESVSRDNASRPRSSVCSSPIKSQA